MEQTGLPFQVEATNVDETLPPHMEPEQAVAYLSRIKAEPLNGKGKIVIGADTVVAIDRQILGKPKDEQEALRMLTLLSGREHSVYTGVTILSIDKIITFTTETKVTFYPLTKAEIRAYIATGEPMDKAGAYGIQGKGALLVKELKGDYFNVVGLPVSRLWRELRQFVRQEGTNGTL